MLRMTCREFYSKQCSHQACSNILSAAFGKEISINAYDKPHPYKYEFRKRKTSPSDGGIYPVEPFIFIYNVENIPESIYWYCSDTHVLYRENTFKDNDKKYQEMSYTLCGQDFNDNTCFGILLSVDVQAINWKYKNSGPINYKVMAIEVGHFSQTLQLCATSERMQTWITSLFNDEIMHAMTNTTSLSMFNAFYISFGYSDFISMNKTYRDAVENIQHENLVS